MIEPVVLVHDDIAKSYEAGPINVNLAGGLLPYGGGGLPHYLHGPLETECSNPFRIDPLVLR